MHYEVEDVYSQFQRVERTGTIDTNSATKIKKATAHPCRITTMAAETQKQLALAILDHLQACIASKVIKEEDSESVGGGCNHEILVIKFPSVAIQCIGEAFGVDSANTEHRSKFAIPNKLLDIFDVFLSTQKAREGGEVWRWGWDLFSHPRSPVLPKSRMSRKRRLKSSNCKVGCGGGGWG